MIKKRHKVFFGAVALLLWIAGLFAQAPDTLWTKTFGGIDRDQGWSVIETSDSGFAVLGWTESMGAGNLDVYLVKTDQNGNYLWHQTFGGSSYEEGRSILETTDKGFIIVGLTQSYGAGNNDVYLIKTDSLGNEDWSRTIGGTGDDRGYDVQITTDGGYIITGYTYSYGSGSADVYLIKTNSNGNVTWQYPFGLSGPDRGWSVKEVSDGYVIAGNTESFGQGLDVYLVKTNLSGDSLWAKHYGGSGSDRAHWLDVTYDGRYIIVGYVGSFGVSYTDVWLLKTYANGDTMWTKFYGGLGWDAGYTVRETVDRGYIIAGYTYSTGAGGADVYLIRTDSLGNSLWTKTVGGSTHDRGHDINFTSDGGYIITGFTRSFGAGDKDMYLIKTETDPSSIEEKKHDKNNFLILQSKPNPFKNRTLIRYSLPKKNSVEIIIYNILGQEVRTLVKRREEAGTHSVIWDGKDNASKDLTCDIYFLKFKAGECKSIHKLVLLR